MLSELSVYSAHGIMFDVDVSVGETPPSAMTGVIESSHLTLRGFLSFFLSLSTFSWDEAKISSFSNDTQSAL